MTSIGISVEDGQPESALVLPWRGAQSDPLRTDLSRLLSGLSVSDAAVDLLALAVSVYAADKALLRQNASDRWTRAIELRLPQIEPDRWPSSEVESFLRHLTGDHWTVTAFKSERVRERIVHGIGPTLQVHPSEVGLFSGGLDSYAYASASEKPLRLIAHKDKSRLAPLQQELADGLVAGAELRQFMVWIQSKPPISWEPEASTRSRSFVFVAAAVAVANATGTGECIVPENGFISLNPPLVPGRTGTLSTRTTHPWTLHVLNRLLEHAELGVTLRNPYAFMTKGDVARIALEHAPSAQVFSTVSCSRPRARRRERIHYGNCGYCYPCLVRRSGFLAAGVDDQTDYRADPRTDRSILSSVRGDDFKAVVTGVRRTVGVRDLTAASRLPVGSPYDQYVDVVRRSFHELIDMIEFGLSNDVRTAIGW